MIRFDSDYNSEIYKTVRNFNRKIRRLSSKGVRNLPEPISTRYLKRNYQERGLLNKQLKLYREFGHRDALTEVETSGGAKLSKWELEYYKANVNNTIKFLEREEGRINNIDTEYRVLRNDYKNNLKTKINLLERGLDESTPRLLQSQQQIISDFLNNQTRMRAGFKNWLSIIDRASSFAKVDKKVVSSLKNKLQNLSEQQFTDLYHTQGLVQRVFELQYEEDKGVGDEEDTNNLITTLEEQIDSMIDNLD